MGLSRREFQKPVARQNWYSYRLYWRRSLWCCYLSRPTCNSSVQGRRKLPSWRGRNRTNRASFAFWDSTRWLPWSFRRWCAQFTWSYPVQQDGPFVSNSFTKRQLLNVPRLNLLAKRSCWRCHHWRRAQKNTCAWSYHCLWHDCEGASECKRDRAVDKSTQWEDAS